MIIFCNGMIRSGSTLQYNIVKLMVEGANMGTAIGYFDKKKLIESSDELIRLSRSDTYYVLKTHDVYPDLDALLKSRSALVCYIVRDIRDVAVSVQNVWGRKGGDLLNTLDEAIAAYQEIRSMPNIFYQRYEDLMKSPSKEIYRLAGYLNIALDDDLLSEILKNCSIDMALARVQKNRKRVSYLLKKMCPWLRDKIVSYDDDTLLHDNHISKHHGQIGVWKKALDSSLLVEIEQRYSAFLSDNYAASKK